MTDASPARHDKFRTYRERKKAKGLREVRMWVIDVNAPGFQERLDTHIAAINASAEDREIFEEMQQAAAELWDKYP